MSTATLKTKTASIDMYLMLLIGAGTAVLVSPILGVLIAGAVNGDVADFKGISMGIYMLCVVLQHQRVFISRKMIIPGPYEILEKTVLQGNMGELFSLFLFLLPLLAVIGLGFFGIKTF